MGFQREENKTLCRRWVVQCLVVVIVLFAVVGWKWLLDRSLQNERVAWQQRWHFEQEQQLRIAIREVRERLLGEQREVLQSLSADSSVAEVSGVLDHYTVSAVLRPESEFRAIGTLPENLEQELRIGEVSWMSDGEGRDALAARLVMRAGEKPVWEVLRPRLLGVTGPPMKASFRHWLIEEAKRIRGEADLSLEALSYSESLRASGIVPAEGIRDGGHPIELWWSEQAIVKLFAEQGVSVRLGLSGQDLGLWGGPLKVELREDFAEDERRDLLLGMPRLLVVGILSGGAMVFALGISFWWSNRERKLALLRTDLAASVAHELRTPLAGQRVLLESLSGDLEQTPEEQMEYLRLALKENQRLSSLAEQFLTFSRLERGKMKLEAEQVVVADLVERVVADWREKFSEVRIEIPEVPDERAQLDSEVVSTILRNLVENAYKYTPDLKKLRIVARKEGGSWLLCVGDNGPGLLERDRERVFGKFWRADDKLSRETEGLGLGLFIVRSLAEAHRGTVSVGEAEWGGAQFEVRLEELV